MAEGRRRASLAGAVMDALLRAPPLPVPMPDPVVSSLFALRRFSARLRGRSVSVRGYAVPYLEGGEGEPVVLLHGFGDDKDSFVDVARSLTPRRRVVLPDLLGFGAASQPRDIAYGLSLWVDLLEDFRERIGLPRFDLGGNSLGGAIAAAYALRHPTRVRRLVLIDAAGVRMPRPSPLQRQLDAGCNPFVLHSLEQYRAWIRFVLEVPPVVPPAVERFMARAFIERAELHAKIMDDILEEDVDLTPLLPAIDAPTLVLWGRHDRLIDPSAAEVFHREIPDAHLVVMDDIGHCPQYEAPAGTAAVLQEFLQGARPARPPR